MKHHLGMCRLSTVLALLLAVLAPARAQRRVGDGSREGRLIDALLYRHTDLAWPLIVAGGLEWDAYDGGGHTALLAAVRHGDAALVGALVDAGASVDFPGGESTRDHGSNEGSTPLILAIRYGYEPIVELLLARGADVLARGADGRDALSMCVSAGNERIFDRLIRAGAKPDSVDEDGATPLMLASKDPYNAGMILKLLDLGADIGAADRTGRTALAHAVENDAVDAAMILLARGAGPDPVDDQGLTPLLRLAGGYRVRPALVLALADRGASIHRVDAEGRTAADILRKRGMAELAALLDGRRAQAARTPPALDELRAATSPGGWAR